MKDKIIEINKEKSQEFLSLYSSALTPNECYINLFNVFRLLGREWDLQNDKLVYGYITTIKDGGFGEFKEATRHCWLYYKGNHIEVTPNVMGKDYSYLPFRYINASEYFDLIEENDMFPSLDKVLINDEEKLKDMLNENGYLTCSDFLAKLGLSENEYIALSDEEKHIISLQMVMGLL